MGDDKFSWRKNVGTYEHPVSLLHEYAVALIWQELNHGLMDAPGASVRVLTASGDMSENLLEGMKRVEIPNNLSPIAGMVPDIALYDSKNMPVRVVEVEVASPVKAENQARYERLGIELVRVRVSGWQDLACLCWTPVEARFWYDVGRNPSSEVRYQRYYEDEQNKADKKVADLVEAIQRCSPQARRQFLNIMRGMRENEMEATHPILPSNPKWEILSEHMPALSKTLPPRPPYWVWGG